MKQEPGTIQEQMLHHSKVQTVLTACILIAIIFLVVYISVQVTGVTSQLDNLDLEEINESIGVLQTMSEELSQMDLEALNETVSALKTVAEKLAEVDPDAINEAVVSLSAAADNLGDLDMEELNALIESLEAVASQMEATSNAFNNLFKR